MEARINRLPPEVFLLVISFCLDNRSPSYRKHINSLRRVCRSWNQVIRDTPQLWGTIKDTDGVNWTRLALVYSKDQPLDILFGTYGDLGVLQLLLPHIHRFRSFSYRITSTIDNLPEELLTTPAPTLTHLQLSATTLGQTVPLFNRQYSLLKHLQLQNVRVPWEESFPCLEHLELEGLWDGSLSINRLLGLLAHCPQILRFKLRNNFFDPNTYGQIPPDPITLPRLTSLILDYISPTDALIILLHLVVPACRTLEVGCTVFGDYLEAFQQLLQKLPHSPVGRYIVGSCVAGARPKVIVDQPRLSMQIKSVLTPRRPAEGQFKLQIRAFDSVDLRVLSHFATLWRLVHKEDEGVDLRLRFTVVHDYIVRQCLDAICEHLPETESLSIKYDAIHGGWLGGGTEILLPLYETVVQEHDSRTIRTWRLPALTELRIVASSVISRPLEELLKQRAMSLDSVTSPRLKLFVAGQDRRALGFMEALKDLDEYVEFMSFEDFDMFMDDKSYPS